MTSPILKIYAQVSQEKGRIDILFANAGIASQNALMGQITELQFDLTFGINVRGLLFSVQKALPLMPDGASIIMNGSAASIKALPTQTVYSATKAAVRSFRAHMDIRAQGAKDSRQHC